ncbi:hypothetical protein B0H14DRAFT_3503256 [Mycena olivaceomarginata]|nr:hypothetical protein B0H14DRAFT_3503256 [Mycena olivaceomarginata]
MKDSTRSQSGGKGKILNTTASSSAATRFTAEGGFDVNEQPQTLVATLSRGSGPPPEIRDLDVGSPTPAGNTLPSDCQPRIRTKPNDTSPVLTVVKVKVHINEAMFVLQVPQTIDYEGLVEKIMCKLRLLGPPLEEPMALEECQPGDALAL